jgi:hypothetical protein
MEVLNRGNKRGKDWQNILVETGKMRGKTFILPTEKLNNTSRA